MSARQAAWISLMVTGVIWLALASLRAGIGPPSEVDIFLHLLAQHDYYAAIAACAVLVAAMHPVAQAAGTRLAQACASHPWGVALAATAVLVAAAPFVYHRHPLSMDEYGPVFQSAAFARGSLTARFPPELYDWLIPAGFRNVFFKADSSGAVASMYWPGFALLLTPFTALGVPWLLNPLIGGATVVVMHRLATVLLGSQAAGYVVLFTVASSAVTINTLSLYSWPAHLLANACYALLLLQPSASRAFAAGVVGSIALALHNPFPHLLFAPPWFLWLAARPDRGRLLAALIVGYLPLVAVIGFGWRLFLRGFDSGLAVEDLATPVGLTQTFWQSVSGIIQWPRPEVLLARLWGLAKLWLWAVPGLLAVAAYGAWKMPPADRRWGVLLACALLTFFGYFFVRYDQGHGWGYRYFHSAWFVLPLFAAAVLKEEVRTYLAGCAAVSLVALTALRAAQVEQFMDRHLEQLPRPAAGEVRVLIVDPAGGYYAQDLVQNDPFLRNPVLVLASRGREADEAMMAKRFPQLRRLSSSERGTAWGYAPR
jgi:hypothetical protein